MARDHVSYPRIWAYDNLYTAWRNAARRKRRSPGAAGFEYALIDSPFLYPRPLRSQHFVLPHTAFERNAFHLHLPLVSLSRILVWL